MEFLKSLNPQQREAVIGFDTPSLIIAGAGSGKTRTLTSRIAYMISQGVAPWRIMALTFTNKAASEMRSRISEMVGPEQSSHVWMGTFHSIFLRILRAEADKTGFPASFSIYDTGDSKAVIREIVKEMKLNDEHYRPGVIQARISLAKNNLVTPAAYRADGVNIARDEKQRMPMLVDIYEAYARRCKELGAMDFDDMLLYINILFRDHPEVTQKYADRFRYVLVDEYQDTNYAQYVIIRRLALGGATLCVVGDDSQSIYSFRGARIENILRFKNDFPDAATYKLEQNYRSTKCIVEAANSVIAKNDRQIEKSSFSEGNQGEKISILKAYTDTEEASIVADRIRALVRNGEECGRMAVLYRTNMQSRVIEEALRRRNIPYRILSGMSFYQRKEIKDILAYIKLIINPLDDEAFRRIINYPARGLGDATLGKIMTAARDRDVSLWDAACSLDPDQMEIRGATLRKLNDFVELIRSLGVARNDMDIYKFGVEVATRSGITGLYRAENTPEAAAALDNIEELLNSIQTFASEKMYEEFYDYESGEIFTGASIKPDIDLWLQNIALLTDADKVPEEERDKVALMTVHAAKGLEFNHVFIVGLEENLFPSMMSLNAPEGLEEERRLFYVALTRAKKEVVITCSQTRFKWGRTEGCTPSRFLKEIDSKYIDAPNVFDESPDNRAGLLADRQQSGVRKESAERRLSGVADTVSGRKYDANIRKVLPQNLRRIESKPSGSLPPCSDNHEYRIGATVEHSKFGRGCILDIEELSSDQKLTIEFETWGRKVILAGFARLKIID